MAETDGWILLRQELLFYQLISICFSRLPATPIMFTNINKSNNKGALLASHYTEHEYFKLLSPWPLGIRTWLWITGRERCDSSFKLSISLTESFHSSHPHFDWLFIQLTLCPMHFNYSRSMDIKWIWLPPLDAVAELMSAEADQCMERYVAERIGWRNALIFDLLTFLSGHLGKLIFAYSTSSTKGPHQ